MFVLGNVIKPQGLEPLQFPTKFRSPSLEESWSFNRARETLVGGTVAAGYSFGAGWQLNTEFSLLRVSQETDYAVLVPALSPMIRWLAYRGRDVSFFLELGPGVSYASDMVPRRGTRFNYVFQAGGGLGYRLRAGFSLVSGLRWFHLSNNNLAGRSRNPDIQALGGYVGIIIG